MWMYILLASVRVLWSLMPQQGYIHPDEFFQSVEVIAGDVLNITVERTWEFDPKSPLRSMVINNAVFTPVYTLLHYFSSTLGLFTLTGRCVVSASRLVMVCLSFMLDYNVWKIAKVLNLDAYRGVILLSYSYVMLTYQTHSLSNSLESVLFLIVIAMIVECGKCESLDSYIYRKGKRNKKLGDYVKEDEGMSSPEVNDIGVKRMEKSTVRSRKVRKDQLKKSKVTGLPKSERKQNGVNSTQSLRGPLPSHVTFTDCLALAFINTLGIFNRPTFALFTVAPFLYWCYSMRSDMFLLFGRISLFVVSSLLCTAVFCGFDTMYYKECSVTDIISRHNLMEELVFTPWNFVKYNSVSSNLELHGRHPFYLHFLVNLPLLFGPMTLLLYYGCLSVIKDFFSNLRLCSSILQGTKTKEERLDSSADALNFHKLLVIIFIITPVTLLSIFPHQEPRFLTPLLPVVILFTLYTSSVSGESFIFINVLFNVILSVVFGVLHQGGVIPCLFKLNELTSMNEMSHYNTTVLFSNTYMPPRHILLQKETSGVTILDLKGSNSEIIEEAILKIEQKWEDDHYGQKINELLLVMPGTVLQNFKKEIKSKLNFNVIEQFYFHLTLEDPPVFTHKAAIDQMSLFLLKVSTNN